MTQTPTDRNQARRDAQPELLKLYPAPWHVTMDGVKNADGVWIMSASNTRLMQQICDLANFAALAMQEPASEPPERALLREFLSFARSGAHFAYPLGSLQKLENALGDCPDEGCPQYGTSHSHTPTSAPASARVTIESYAESYSFEGDNGSYTPNDWQRDMLIDFAHGLLTEMEPASALPCCGWEKAAIEFIRSIQDSMGPYKDLNGHPIVGGAGKVYQMYWDARAQPCRCGELLDALEPFVKVAEPIIHDDRARWNPEEWSKRLNKLTVGDFRKLFAATVPASDPICRKCASGEPGIPEVCMCGDYPAPASAPSCCGADRLADKIQDIAAEFGDAALPIIGEYVGEWQHTRRRAQPCQCGEVREIEEMLDAGQGDDEGPQILPDFNEGMSTVAKVEECLHLLEKRRDVIAGYAASASSCCWEEAAKIADERGYELRAYAHRASDKVSLGQDAVAMAECFRVGQLIRSMAKAVCAKCKIGTSHE